MLYKHAKVLRSDLLLSRPIKQRVLLVTIVYYYKKKHMYNRDIHIGGYKTYCFIGDFFIVASEYADY